MTFSLCTDGSPIEFSIHVNLRFSVTPSRQQLESMEKEARWCRVQQIKTVFLYWLY